VLATWDICLENELVENNYPNRLEQIVADNRNIYGSGNDFIYRLQFCGHGIKLSPTHSDGLFLRLIRMYAYPASTSLLFVGRLPL